MIIEKDDLKFEFDEVEVRKVLELAKEKYAANKEVFNYIQENYCKLRENYSYFDRGVLEAVSEKVKNNDRELKEYIGTLELILCDGLLAAIYKIPYHYKKIEKIANKLNATFSTGDVYNAIRSFFFDRDKTEWYPPKATINHIKYAIEKSSEIITCSYEEHCKNVKDEIENYRILKQQYEEMIEKLRDNKYIKVRYGNWTKLNFN